MNSNEKLNIHVENLDFSQHTWRCVHTAGCKTLGDIADKASWAAIRNGRNQYGKGSRQEIDEKLVEHGLPTLTD
jgi:DNA-directed RNA polymerase alpha subunit